MNKRKICFITTVFILSISVLTGCNKEEADKDAVDRVILDYAQSVVTVPEIETGSEPVIISREEYEKENEKAQVTEETQAPTPTPEPVSSPKNTAVSDPYPYEGIRQPVNGDGLEKAKLLDFNAPVMELNINNYKNVKFDSGRNLQEMEGYFKEGNQAALDDLAHLDRYIAMSFSLRGTEEYIYFGDTNSAGLPHGTGIAVYADNQYYYGEWVNGKREGFGWWEHFHIHLTKNHNDMITFHQYKGDFKDDLPNGSGQDHYEYDVSKVLDNSKTITNYLCNYVDGRVDGEVFCTVINKKNEVFQYQGNAVSGTFEYIYSTKDSNKRGPVLYAVENPEDCIWLSEKENRDIGVVGYISKYKK